MRYLHVCLLVAGTALGGVAIQHLRRGRPAAPTRIPFAYIMPVPIAIAPPAPPAPPRRSGCADSPATIGTPSTTQITTPPPLAHVEDRYWRVVAAADRCVIAAWSGATVVASWDDGATFAPILEDRSPILGVAVRADGTIFVMREDFNLGIAYVDGSSISRPLAFRGEPFTRGRWLVLRTHEVSAISDDDGATWRQLESDQGYLADLHVLDDGAIVASFDLSGELCDHFGCGDGPLMEYRETHLDGRPWRPASPRHVRASSIARTPAAVPPGRTRDEFGDASFYARRVLDSHRLPLEVVANRYVVRYTGAAGWRVLFTGAAS